MVHDYDDIIELTDVVVDESSQNDEDVIELTQESHDGEALSSNGSTLSRKEGEDTMPPVGQSDIEAVLEKIIEKKFSGIIEKILFEVTEKVIKREIEDIKAGLKKDLDDIG
nr:hypothetical protein [uncultured Desulfobacter sp.]